MNANQRELFFVILSLSKDLPFFFHEEYEEPQKQEFGFGPPLVEIPIMGCRKNQREIGRAWASGRATSGR
jgi:hypothetical protein